MFCRHISPVISSHHFDCHHCSSLCHFMIYAIFSHKTTSQQNNMHYDSTISSFPLLSFSLSSVPCSICGLRQVSSQPGGGGDLLRTDRPVGQPQSPSDPRPEDPPVCCCTHCKAGSITNMTIQLKSTTTNCEQRPDSDSNHSLVELLHTAAVFYASTPATAVAGCIMFSGCLCVRPILVNN